MNFPNTPNSIIGELIKNQKGRLWEKSWGIFFDTYNEIIRIMAKNILNKIGWSDLQDSELEEIQANIFLTLFKIFENAGYKPENHRFRGFLKKVATCRIIDYIRSKNSARTITVESLELVDALQKCESDDFKCSAEFEKLEKNEERVYRMSIIKDIYETIRLSFSPETCLAFEMTQFDGKSVKETCEILDIDRAKVDKAVYRIVKKIKEEMDKEIYRKELSK